MNSATVPLLRAVLWFNAIAFRGNAFAASGALPGLADAIPYGDPSAERRVARCLQGLKVAARRVPRPRWRKRGGIVVSRRLVTNPGDGKGPGPQAGDSAGGDGSSGPWALARQETEAGGAV